MENLTTHPECVLVRAQLKAELGITFSNPTLIRLEKKGEFPKRFYLSSKLPVWRTSEVVSWIEAKRHAFAPNDTTKHATEGKKQRSSRQAVPQ